MSHNTITENCNEEKKEQETLLETDHTLVANTIRSPGGASRNMSTYFSTVTRCPCRIVNPANKIHQPNVGPMLDQRRRSFFSVVPSKHDTSTQCLSSVENGGPALDQHWVDVSCLMGTTLKKRLLVKQV